MEKYFYLDLLYENVNHHYKLYKEITYILKHKKFYICSR